MLAILGTQPDPMGWGTSAEAVRPFLPPDASVESFDDTGHFVHIERPDMVSELILDFLGASF